MQRSAAFLLAALAACAARPPSAPAGEAAQPPAAPAPPASGTLTLEDCVDLAFERNIEFRRNVLADMRSATDLDAAWGRWMPTLSTSYGLNKAGARSAMVSVQQEIPLGTMVTATGNAGDGQDGGPTASASVTVSQSLLRGFGLSEALADLRSKKIGRLQAQAALERQAETLTQYMKASVYNITGAEQTVIVQKQAVVASRKNLEIVQAQVDQKIKATSDLSKAKIQLADRENSLAASRALLASNLDQLKVDLDLPLQTELAVAYNVPFEARRLDPDALVREALSERVDLASARLDLARSEMNLEQARRHTLYDLSLSTTLSKNGAGDTLGGAFKLRGDTDWSTALTLTYPLGQVGDRAALARAKIDLESQQLAVRGAAKNIEAEVRRIARALNVTATTVGNLEIKLDAARQDVAATRELYGVGRVTAFELTSVEDAELAAQVGLIQAKLDYVRQWADLERSVGRSTGRAAKPDREEITDILEKWSAEKKAENFDLGKWLKERKK
jgi:outer membrane protein TolC